MTLSNSTHRWVWLLDWASAAMDAWLYVFFWVLKEKLIYFSHTAKHVICPTVRRKMAQLADDKILKDNLPKTFDAVMSTCSHSLSRLSGMFSSCRKQMDSQWLAAQSSQHLNALEWEKKQIVRSSVLLWCTSHRGYSVASEAVTEEDAELFAFIYFQVYLSLTRLTRLILKGRSSVWKKN